MALTLLPCKPDVCQECAVDHHPTEPHDALSLYYQYRFYGQNGRWPNWLDAMSHCDQTIQQLWKEELTAIGQPLDGFGKQSAANLN